MFQSFQYALGYYLYSKMVKWDINSQIVTIIKYTNFAISFLLLQLLTNTNTNTNTNTIQYFLHFNLILLNHMIKLQHLHRNADCLNDKTYTLKDIIISNIKKLPIMQLMIVICIYQMTLRLLMLIHGGNIIQQQYINYQFMSHFDWTPEQDKCLLDLKDQFKKTKISWKRVAFKLSSTQNVLRSANQCRLRYQKFLKNQSYQSSQWTFQQIEALKHHYLEHGPFWLKISQLLRSKSEGSTKNKFYWIIKRGCKKLQEKEKLCKKMTNKTINFKGVSNILDLSSRIQKWVGSKGLSINSNINLKKRVVEFCFKSQEWAEEEAEILIYNIKELSFNLRSFKLFKNQSKRDWRLTQIYLRSLQNYDSFVCQEEKFIQLLSMERKKKSLSSTEQTSFHFDKKPEHNLESLSYQSIEIAESSHQLLQLSYPQHPPLKLSPFKFCEEDLLQDF